jgi:L-iditol 2-dehydrogenase
MRSIHNGRGILVITPPAWPSASYSFWGVHPELKVCLGLVAAGKLNAKRLVTHRYPRDKIHAAFDVVADKDKNKSIFVNLTN